MTGPQWSCVSRKAGAVELGHALRSVAARRSAGHDHGRGYIARCLHHETDHINGIVMGDRLSKRARRQLRSDHDERAVSYPANWPA
ncbi:peptide deformylase [Flexivirga caeni]|uniref:Peptide deformylase n=1 Tax=Flexivirga caeni TaxID=2294115 RepID=A0A3M9M7R7_9MICO|nr:peptide deformylase [Flexivirga caeni]RNI21614.1 hypothetical protein EFY87_10645 [Flexivirga caeni]